MQGRLVRFEWCEGQTNGYFITWCFRPCNFGTCKKEQTVLRCSGQIQAFGLKSLPDGRSRCAFAPLPPAGKGLVLSSTWHGHWETGQFASHLFSHQNQHVSSFLYIGRSWIRIYPGWPEKNHVPTI
jgi:hypothetical protein